MSTESVHNERSGPEQAEDAMRNELEVLKKRVAFLEHQLVLKKAPKPLSFSVSHSFKRKCEICMCNYGVQCLTVIQNLRTFP